jgi:transcriptional regulator with XRE-family HTH domain
MADVLRWRKRNGLTQVAASSLLGVSQPYLSLLEKGARPLTAALRDRMKNDGGQGEKRTSDDLFRAQLSGLGYPGFAHVEKSRRKPRPDSLLMAVLVQPDVDARVVEALPWLVMAFKDQLDVASMVRQAKLQNLQNRLGFLLQAAGVDSPGGLLAVRELDRARLLREDTLCWDSMPAATREWMRANRTPLAAHWNVLTRVQAEDIHDAA